MVTAYRSGRPRVHASVPEAGVLAAIEEYERVAADPGTTPELARDLQETAADLKEELEMRENES